MRKGRVRGGTALRREERSTFHYKEACDESCKPHGGKRVTLRGCFENTSPGEGGEARETGS